MLSLEKIKKQVLLRIIIRKRVWRGRSKTVHKSGEAWVGQEEREKEQSILKECFLSSLPHPSPFSYSSQLVTGPGIPSN